VTEPITLGVGLASTGLVALVLGVLQLRSPTFWLEFAWRIPPDPEPGWPEVAVRVLGAVFVRVGPPRPSAARSSSRPCCDATPATAFADSRGVVASRRQDLIRSRPEFVA
jgi:hypothetical protein